MTFNFNEIFEPVFFADNRYIDIWGGRGRGGSHFGTDYFLFKMIQPQYFRGYFIREKFSDIRHSLYRDFRDRIDENPSIRLSDFRIKDNEMYIKYLPNGNEIISRGVASEGKRTAKMKSLAGATNVLIEEADELGEADFNQMDLSLRTIKAEKVEIMRIFNPPPIRHWIWKGYNLTPIKAMNPFTRKNVEVHKAVPKSDRDILSIHSTYKDNLINLQASTISRFEQFAEEDEPYYFNQVKGYIINTEKGQIYTRWKPISLADYNALILPRVYGLDFGYSEDPNALIEMKYDGRRRFCKEMIYETDLDDLQLAMKLRDVGITPNDLILADYGNGGDVRIANLRRGWGNQVSNYADLRFNIHPCIKGRINAGINQVKTCHNYYVETSSNLITEIMKYKWALDSDKVPTDTPIDKYNHLLDARRYAELGKGRVW